MPRSPVQNIKRRGAVYWWRRTLSLGKLAFSENRLISLEFSLFTKELDSARGRAAAMTAYSERLKMSFRDNVAQFGLDEQTISSIFVEEVRSYRNELVHLEATWKAHPEWSRVSNREDDLGVFQALWKGIADEGVGVPRDWDFVEKHFAEFDHDMQCRVRDLLRDHRDLPESLRLTAQARLEQAGAPSNAVSIPVAVDVIARARAEAARRVKENSDFNDLAKLASLATSFVKSVMPHGTEAPAASHFPSASPLLPASLNAEQQRYAAMSPTEFAEVFIGEKFGGLEHREGNKRQREIVQESTFRDIRWVAVLLEKAMPEGVPFSQVTMEHVTNLDSWFDLLPTTIGKSPKDREPETTFEMIRERALERIDSGELSPEQIGLSVNTSNKHWQNFARMHKYLRSLVPGVFEVDVSKFVTPETKDEREARDAYTKEQGQAIFSLPPWTGCAGLDDRLKSGTHIIHDALFFILLLVWYTGARREEICKLKLDDVFDSEPHGIPYIFIRPTDTGRIKCKSSKRKIPLHEELFRLGFLKYVAALRAAGETLLFAEMYPSSGTKRKIGDVFYKNWWIYLRPFVPDLKRGQAMHAARHSCSDALKQAGITLEKRNDFLGQSQKALGEGAARYSEPLALKGMKEMLTDIPSVTLHLDDVSEINLLPAELRVQRPSREKKV
ncbi:tyrosine-type recombinase/integrase [Qipengyuania nanhaisediminis]|uniref:Phage integrase family protein n=1 Tax=Qipengyuania nanhaisediminis TaxID=604088 RepID=A0A1I5MFC5_9SPHN|nr:tyrosine-type recombinase/integrase [Qipengyuania nanhaisediminis]SFP07651.1 Phage integrase family protein [Qipengyuania nanhaisediminis]